MSIAGRVESLWRYPVKSMRGEELKEAFAGFAGVYGDRIYAFRSSAAPTGFPYLTGREQPRLLLYRPIFRSGAAMARPGNLAEAEALSPGLTTVYASDLERIVDVRTPAGERLAIDDCRLAEELCSGLGDRHELKLLHSDRAMTDCRPISLLSVQTVRQLSDEVGAPLDKRRFRANMYLDLTTGAGFGEDEFVGRTLRIGEKARVAILKRDSRCKMITIDPETAQANPEVMKSVAKFHEGKAGVYAAVLVEGMIRAGDEVVLLPS